MEDDDFDIRFYTSNQYKYINNDLRKREISLYTENFLKSWICCLYETLSRNRNVKNGTIVYRAMGNKFQNEFGVGSKFYFREFLSTSTNLDFCKKWIKNKGTIMIIEIKNNGTEGHQNYCYYIEDITFTKNQKEILLSTHCYFTVTKIEKRENINYIYLICVGILLDKIKEEYLNKIKLVYKNEINKDIRIFGDEFVKNNKNNCYRTFK